MSGSSYANAGDNVGTLADGEKIDAIPPSDHGGSLLGIRDAHDVALLEQSEPTLVGAEGTTYELLVQGAALAPQSPACSFFLTTADYQRPWIWTHKEWLGRITQTANMFRSLGVGRQDVIAFVMPNLPESHWVIWGGEAAGIVFAINPLLETPLILELLLAAKAKWLVTIGPTPGSDIWQKVSAVAPKVPSLKGILTAAPSRYLRGVAGILFRPLARLRTPTRLAHLEIRDLVAESSQHAAGKLTFDPPTADAKASYFCTGGTTGIPKIAVRTHRTERANALQLIAAFGSKLSPGKTSFCGLPLFHVNAQIGTGLAMWAKGAHIVLGTPQGYRAPGLIEAFWDIAAHYKINSFSGVPTVYSSLLQAPRQGRVLSTMDYGICGAAPMPKELFNRFQRDTGIRILEGYGLTEGGCVSTINPPAGIGKSGSIGIKLPWQRVVPMELDANGSYVRDAAIDETGVICINGPNLFQGYLNPAHNRGIWVMRPGVDGKMERWLNTGDLGRVDANGYFWLTGRRKELIIRGGHNIDPRLIEECLQKHSSVALVAAIGRPDVHSGEIPIAYVQLGPGQQATPNELLSYAHGSIPERAAWPKEIKIVSALPTTPVGKIFKPALVLREMESVVVQEAKECGAALSYVEGVQDSQLGLTIKWSASARSDELRARLDRYAFHHRQIDNRTPR